MTKYSIGKRKSFTDNMMQQKTRALLIDNLAHNVSPASLSFIHLCSSLRTSCSITRTHGSVTIRFTRTILSRKVLHKEASGVSVWIGAGCVQKERGRERVKKSEHRCEEKDTVWLYYERLRNGWGEDVVLVKESPSKNRRKEKRGRVHDACANRCGRGQLFCEHRAWWQLATYERDIETKYWLLQR